MAIGCFMVALSAMCLSLDSVWTALLQSYHISPIMLTGIRMSFTAIFAGIILAATKTNLKITKQQLIYLLTLGVIGVGVTGILITSAVGFMSVGLVVLCHYTYPIIVALASCFLFQEKLTKWKIIAAVCMIAGLALTSGGGTVSIIGVILAICSAFTFASYVIAVDHSCMRDIPGFKLLFYVTLFTSVLIFGALAVSGNLTMPAIHKVYLVQAIGALITQVGGIFLLAEGIKRIGATKAGFLSILEPASALVWDTIIFHTSISALSCMGIVLMFTAFLTILKDGPAHG